MGEKRGGEEKRGGMERRENDRGEERRRQGERRRSEARRSEGEVIMYTYVRVTGSVALSLSKTILSSSRGAKKHKRAVQNVNKGVVLR